ncbi:hypothetical protein EBQ25_04335 [Allofranklinella schreckenbergeri]|uniref:Uncharacterized protein n=1 Tax=Allofranklinella schreckenbergeri TaxID=1076744 RepID=A0A3M6QD31_9BURK|nr:hypothetical protein [Allofranklinella schreckenbergeri]RMX01028.1 hypothetical protein EBQ25_04335 [Allofranklinella schreckenbergeri]
MFQIKRKNITLFWYDGIEIKFTLIEVMQIPGPGRKKAAKRSTEQAPKEPGGPVRPSLHASTMPARQNRQPFHPLAQALHGQ